MSEAEIFSPAPSNFLVSGEQQPRFNLRVLIDLFAIHDVEGMAGSHSRAVIIPFRIAHGQEMGGVQTHEELEVNLFCRKLVGELCEEMLKRTTCA